MDQSKLRDQLITYFSNSELNNLCFDLNIDYQNLPGSTTQDKARELILYCRRHGLWEKLIARCKELRPLASWELDTSPTPEMNQGYREEQSNHSLLTNIFVGVFITVVGGVILAYIIQDARFAPSPTSIPTVDLSPNPSLLLSPVKWANSTEVIPTPSPDQFIRDYFAAINNRNYKQSWEMLSVKFKDEHHCCDSDGSYQLQPYIDWWNTFEKIEVVSISVENRSIDKETVLVVLRYYNREDGGSYQDSSRYRLVWENGRWLIDEQ